VAEPVTPRRRIVYSTKGSSGTRLAAQSYLQALASGSYSWVLLVSSRNHEGGEGLGEGQSGMCTLTCRSDRIRANSHHLQPIRLARYLETRGGECQRDFMPGTEP